MVIYILYLLVLREYDLKYLGKIGNVLGLSNVEKAIELGEKYKDLSINNYCLHIDSVNFGFSSSTTALYLGEIDRAQPCQNHTGKGIW